MVLFSDQDRFHHKVGNTQTRVRSDVYNPKSVVAECQNGPKMVANWVPSQERAVNSGPGPGAYNIPRHLGKRGKGAPMVPRRPVGGQYHDNAGKDTPGPASYEVRSGLGNRGHNRKAFGPVLPNKAKPSQLTTVRPFRLHETAAHDQLTRVKPPQPGPASPPLTTQQRVSANPFRRNNNNNANNTGSGSGRVGMVSYQLLPPGANTGADPFDPRALDLRLPSRTHNSNSGAGAGAPAPKHDYHDDYGIDEYGDSMLPPSSPAYMHRAENNKNNGAIGSINSNSAGAGNGTTGGSKTGLAALAGSLLQIANSAKQNYVGMVDHLPAAIDYTSEAALIDAAVNASASYSNVNRGTKVSASADATGLSLANPTMAPSPSCTMNIKSNPNSPVCARPTSMQSSQRPSPLNGTGGYGYGYENSGGQVQVRKSQPPVEYRSTASSEQKARAPERQMMRIQAALADLKIMATAEVEESNYDVNPPHTQLAQMSRKCPLPHSRMSNVSGMAPKDQTQSGADDELNSALNSYVETSIPLPPAYTRELVVNEYPESRILDLPLNSPRQSRAENEGEGEADINSSDAHARKMSHATDFPVPNMYKNEDRDDQNAQSSTERERVNEHGVIFDEAETDENGSVRTSWPIRTPPSQSPSASATETAAAASAKTKENDHDISQQEAINEWKGVRAKEYEQMRQGKLEELRREGLIQLNAPHQWESNQHEQQLWDETQVQLNKVYDQQLRQKKKDEELKREGLEEESARLLSVENARLGAEKQVVREKVLRQNQNAAQEAANNLEIERKERETADKKRDREELKRQAAEKKRRNKEQEAAFQKQLSLKLQAEKEKRANLAKLEKEKEKEKEQELARKRKVKAHEKEKETEDNANAHLSRQSSAASTGRQLMASMLPLPSSGSTLDMFGLGAAGAGVGLNSEHMHAKHSHEAYKASQQKATVTESPTTAKMRSKLFKAALKNKTNGKITPSTPVHLESPPRDITPKTSARMRSKLAKSKLKSSKVVVISNNGGPGAVSENQSGAGNINSAQKNQFQQTQLQSQEPQKNANALYLLRMDAAMKDHAVKSGTHAPQPAATRLVTEVPVVSTPPKMVISIAPTSHKDRSQVSTTPKQVLSPNSARERAKLHREKLAAKPAPAEKATGDRPLSRPSSTGTGSTSGSGKCGAPSTHATTAIFVSSNAKANNSALSSPTAADRARQMRKKVRSKPPSTSGSSKVTTGEDYSQTVTVDAAKQTVVPLELELLSGADTRRAFQGSSVVPVKKPLDAGLVEQEDVHTDIIIKTAKEVKSELREVPATPIEPGSVEEDALPEDYLQELQSAASEGMRPR